MKKIYAFATLIFTFTFLSFAKPNAQTTGKSSNGATTVSLNQVFEIDGILDNPCTGEPVYFTGKVHLNLHGTMNGNKVSTSSHFNAQNVIGTGLITGNHYTGNQSENYTDNHRLVGDKSTYAYALKLKMVSTGNQPNMIRVENFHVTINANGTGTALHGDSYVECQ